MSEPTPSSSAAGPEARLAELGIELAAHPLPPGPLAAVVVEGDRAWVSGQPPSVGGKILHTGQVSTAVTIEDGHAAARLCATNCLAALQAELGSLDRIDRVVKVVGFVQAPPGFAGHSKVVNGASELLVEVFGAERGRHARSAIGVASLPGDMAVEVEMVVALVDGGS